MSVLNISVQQLRELVTPTIPFASTDYTLPALNAVQIHSRGPWLIATATDRFRLIMHRTKSPDGNWPNWSASIPTATLRNILATFKTTRGLDTDLTLTISDDGHTIEVAAVGLMDMSAATITYPLETSAFPKVSKILTKALAAEVSDTQVGLSPALLRDLPKTASTLRFKVTSPRDPVLFTDGENLVGCIMPKRLSSDGEVGSIVSLDEAWTDTILADAPDKAVA